MRTRWRWRRQFETGGGGGTVYERISLKPYVVLDWGGGERPRETWLRRKGKRATHMVPRPSWLSIFRRPATPIIFLVPYILFYCTAPSAPRFTEHAHTSSSFWFLHRKRSRAEIGPFQSRRHNRLNSPCQIYRYVPGPTNIRFLNNNNNSNNKYIRDVPSLPPVENYCNNGSVQHCSTHSRVGCLGCLAKLLNFFECGFSFEQLKRFPGKNNKIITYFLDSESIQFGKCLP